MTPSSIFRRLAPAVLVLALSPLSAQQTATAKPADDTTPTIKSDVKLVNLPVVVRDKHGALVQTLTKDDFVLDVDHHPQVIRYFDQDANLPLSLGLLVDTSGSMRNKLDEERTASSAFLDSMLKNNRPGIPNDKAFIIQFSAQTELLADLTDSRPKLQAALKDLDSSSPNAQPSDSDDNNGHARRGGGTVLYDAAFLAADEILAKQKGRKALILLTDGEDRNSRETIAKAIEAAQRADTILYAIYFKGEQPHDDNRQQNGGGRHGGGGGGFPGMGGGGMGGGQRGGGYPGGGQGGGQGGGRPTQNHVDGKKILERMTQETGGRVFEATRKQTVADIYKQIGEELRSQYRLGYTPDTERAAEGYHQVDLTLKDKKYKDLTVQTRDGYYTGK